MQAIDHDQPYIIQVHKAFTPDECRELIERIEALEPEIATINSFSGVRVDTSIRNNERVMFDDQPLADTVIERLGTKAPATLHGMSLVGANERFRCYRYKPGMRFAPHADGAFVRNMFERSFYSCLLYLNEDFTGGATTFLTEPEVSIQPETGLILLFQHPLIHEGSLVTAGVKYVARTDLMYRRVNFD